MGEPETKVDLLIMGDGYTANQRDKFEADAKRATEILFSRSPFKEHRKDFNVWGLCPPADLPGISRPSTGVYRHSPLGTSYDTFDSERYIMTTDNKALRDAASFAPYEFIEILTNSKTYGGGGIYNLYATVAADSEWMPYVFVHEFGHEFAGLADEYYTSDVAIEPAAHRIEPWEPNVTALLDPAMLKWKDLVVAGTPIPTPWKKAEFEAYEHDIQAERRKIRKENRSEAEMNALFEKEKQHEDELLGTDKYSDRVGAFEGGNYEAHGYYRPQENCIMFTRYDRFCAVCRRGSSASSRCMRGNNCGGRLLLLLGSAPTLDLSCGYRRAARGKVQRVGTNCSGACVSRSPWAHPLAKSGRVGWGTRRRRMADCSAAR